jgi:hypothetical protein
MIDVRKATWFDFQIESLKPNQIPLRYLKPDLRTNNGWVPFIWSGVALQWAFVSQR